MTSCSRCGCEISNGALCPMCRVLAPLDRGNDQEAERRSQQRRFVVIAAMNVIAGSALLAIVGISALFAPAAPAPKPAPVAAAPVTPAPVATATPAALAAAPTPAPAPAAEASATSAARHAVSAKPAKKTARAAKPVSKTRVAKR